LKPDFHEPGLLTAMGIVLCVLLVGSLLASETCKSGWVEWQLCNALTETGLHLGPALSRW
jgi:hypothetical protein